MVREGNIEIQGDKKMSWIHELATHKGYGVAPQCISMCLCIRNLHIFQLSCLCLPNNP